MTELNQKVCQFTNHYSCFTNVAFTLAETLIVIGIIGVVAALTLPNLNHATGDKEKVTRVKKIYSSLNEAYDRAQAIYGPANEWLADGVCDAVGNQKQAELCNLKIINRLTEFMRVSKIDEDEDFMSCHKVILSDGSSFGVSFGIHAETADEGCYHSMYIPNADYLGDIMVDIDGSNKGKEQDGYDLFRFNITSQGIYPDGIRRLNNDENEERLSLIFSSHYGTQWILENDNMDYLKADEEGVCPDGTQLSWTVTSCN